MKSLIYRVGADSTPAGGKIHGTLNNDFSFIYLPIPERDTTVSTPRYKEHHMKNEIPDSMLERHMHLDPNFEEGNMEIFTFILMVIKIQRAKDCLNSKNTSHFV